ncbi:MAG: ABC transporter permease subunit [Phycisphaera sp.]|nr:ABC transporter permease subunit [Phycisphaera sp.]
MTQNIFEQFGALPVLLAAHLKLTVVALVAGLGVSIPAAILAIRVARLRYPMLTAAGVVQTVPSLALLALMVPALELIRRTGVNISSFGFVPAVIALTMYSILPILRNTVTGVMNIEPAIIEAARGVGMTDAQVMRRVQLPLAAPVVIAGIRTAAVWVVGIATLATPIGQPCLGDYIFTGLGTRNWVMILFGVVFAALLAVILDALIAGVQRSLDTRRPTLGWSCGAALAVVFVGGLVLPSLVSRGAVGEHEFEQTVESDPATLGPIRIGAKTFTEQFILARLIDHVLTDAGYATKRTENLGSTIAFDQLKAGNLDVFVDYSGTVWANDMKRTGNALPNRVLEEITWWLARKHNIRCLGSLGFENSYALAMRRDLAQQLGIQTIADLVPHSPGMVIAGDFEFFGRPEWRALRDGYSLAFKDQKGMNATLMYEAVKTGDVDVISAFSTDGRISAFDLLVLGDPKRVIPPYHAVLLVGPRVASDKRLIRTLRPLVGAITLEMMQNANEVVDVEGQPISQALMQLQTRIEKEIPR